MRFRIVLLAVAVLLAGGVLAPAADEATKQDLHLDIELADGTRILGRTPGVRLTLATAFGNVDFVLAGGDRIDSNDDQETVTLRTGKGDKLRGVLVASRRLTVLRAEDGTEVRGWDWEPSILVQPYGAPASRKVPCGSIRSLRALEPIRIAGSEGARWEVGYENASGWTPENLAGVITVNHIDADTVHSASGGNWSTVRLSRKVEPRDDFHLAADISWDDRGAGLRAMQNLFISVVDADGGLIAAVGHNDAWVGETGSRYAQMPGVSRTRSSGYNTQPTCGKAKLDITRTDCEITILWDGVSLHTGKSPLPVSRVEVAFEFYAYRSGWRESAFGSAVLHRLELR